MNKFWYRGALPPDSAMFVGREKELSIIARLCRGEVQSYVIIFGARQAGKTSLLYRLGQQLSAQNRVVQISLQEYSGYDSVQTFSAIAAELIERLAPAKAPTAAHINSAPSLRKLLCAITLPGITVIALDELGAISLRARLDLANALRSFHDTRFHPGRGNLKRYIFVLAGGIELYDLATKDVSPLYNISERIYLGDLSRAESDELLRRGLGAETTAEMAERIYYHAHGHPYLTQRLGGIVESWLEHEGRAPTIKQLDAKVNAIAREDTNLVHLANGLSEQNLWDEAQRLVNGETIPFSRLSSTPCRLELLGLIREENGQCAIRNRIYIKGIRHAVIANEEIDPRSRLKAIEEVLATIAGEYERGLIDIGRYALLKTEYESKKAKLERQI